MMNRSQIIYRYNQTLLQCYSLTLADTYPNYILSCATC